MLNLGGSNTYVLLQAWQKMRPQQRQWWRSRTSGRNGLWQPPHAEAMLSGSHCGGSSSMSCRMAAAVAAAAAAAAGVRPLPLQ